MSIWVMENRRDFFNEESALRFMQAMKEQGYETGMSTYRDGFGQRQHTVHWDKED